MNDVMLIELSDLSVTFTAGLAHEWFLSGVNAFVCRIVCFAVTDQTTKRTFKSKVNAVLFAFVESSVPLQRCHVFVDFTAVFALPASDDKL